MPDGLGEAPDVGNSTVALGESSGELGRGLGAVHQLLFTCCEGYLSFFRASAMCLLPLSLSGTYVQILSAHIYRIPLYSKLSKGTRLLRLNETICELRRVQNKHAISF